MTPTRSAWCFLKSWQSSGSSLYKIDIASFMECFGGGIVDLPQNMWSSPNCCVIGDWRGFAQSIHLYGTIRAPFLQACLIRAGIKTFDNNYFPRVINLVARPAKHSLYYQLGRLALPIQLSGARNLALNQ